MSPLFPRFGSESGDKLEGLYTWLQRSKYEDPDKVLAIKDGVLHFTGDGNGYLCTKGRYKDYHLVVEYRWGERTYGDRKTLARSSGVFLHGGLPWLTGTVIVSVGSTTT